MNTDKAREIACRIDKALNMVNSLCKPKGAEGSREWIMSIPAKPDSDPDLVIAEGLQAGKEALAHREQELADANARYEQVTNDWNHEAAIRKHELQQARETIKALRNQKGLLPVCEVDQQLLAANVTCRQQATMIESQAKRINALEYQLSVCNLARLIGENSEQAARIAELEKEATHLKIQILRMKESDYCFDCERIDCICD